jgi:hypothetical protein
MRKIALVAAAALIPLIPTAPAYAADHVICVGNPVGVTCDESFTELAAALQSANVNVVDSAITIRVAAGNYSDGPYFLAAGPSRHFTLQGSGQGSTSISLAASANTQPYVLMDHSTLEDLTVVMNPSMSEGDTGISAADSTVTRVTVEGSNVTAAVGLVLARTTLSKSTVKMDLSSNSNALGVNSLDASTVTDTSISASAGYQTDSVTGPSTMSRVSIRSSRIGISCARGTLTIDDAVLDIGTGSGTGLLADNSNVSNAPKSINASHVTVVGGGANSVGVAAYARSTDAIQQTTVQLTNSIVHGPAIDLSVEAGNVGGLGANSTASITTSYSNWSTKKVISDPNGVATLTNGAGHLDVNPGFVNAAGGDYRLAASSPLIDKGAPGGGAPTLDLAGGTRVLDGNGDGAAVRDMGAYEAPRKPDHVAPDTTLTSHPKKRTTKRRATFGFTANESHATFQCRLDKKAWGICTSPKRVRVTQGWHVFRVRARDAAGNLDPTPARFRFHRV